MDGRWRKMRASLMTGEGGRGNMSERDRKRERKEKERDTE